jgi:hypothetical protein
VNSVRYLDLADFLLIAEAAYLQQAIQGGGPRRRHLSQGGVVKYHVGG